MLNLGDKIDGRSALITKVMKLRDRARTYLAGHTIFSEIDIGKNIFMTEEEAMEAYNEMVINCRIQRI